MSRDNPKAFKLFPLNLTARADTMVRGNPVVTRPESGVENCFPGLEFDQRNLDKAFFPGLLFELHHDAGILLRDFDPGREAAKLLKRADVQQGMYLAFVQGVFALPDASSAPRLLRFSPPAGLNSWRFVRDLEPGRVAIALCGEQTFRGLADGEPSAETVETWFRTRKNRREGGDTAPFLLLFGERSRFLTEEGVIDPALIGAGDLTRSLCSPWQYDFADCGCFYWASNKPDLVSSPAQPQQILNFQRRDRSEKGDAATRAEDWILKYEGRWDDERHILRHAEMLDAWEALPFVVGGRETDRYTPSRAALAHPLLTRAQIIERLRDLAQVEHALAVEYLYAFYSLGIPARPEDGPQPDPRVRTAGEEIFHIAVDEMRHLRAVNEILIELGEAWVLGRASVIGRDYDGNGRAFQQRFELVPLSRAQLDWFIKVERASQNDHSQDTIDGMYTLILHSIAASDEFPAEQKQRARQLVKVIIDEGMEHFRRFTRARDALRELPEASYLKVRGAPLRLAEGHPDRVLQDTADAAYVVVLRALGYVFQMGDRQRGVMMETARRAMYNMDDAARSLALRGVGAMFDLGGYAVAAPAAMAVAAGAGPGAHRPAAIGEPLRPQFDALEQSADPAHRALAGRMRRQLDAMTLQFEKLAAAE
jgi:hypothetical protein